MPWIRKTRLNELEKIEKMHADSIITKAQEADAVLRALGVESTNETGKQIRAALSMELLGQKYDLMDKHSKASFVKDHGSIMKDVRTMLLDEGVLTRESRDSRISRISKNQK